jgi:serine/threonine protein kinase
MFVQAKDKMSSSAELVLTMPAVHRPRWRWAKMIKKCGMETPPHGASLVGIGSFSRVYKLPTKNTVRKMPTEVYDPDTDESSYDISLHALQLEIKIYKSINPSPHLVDFHGATETYLDLEYAPHGTVSDFLRRNYRHQNQSATAPTTPALIAVQTIEAVAYIHSQGIIHCDLGARQLLLDADWNVRLIDFGGSSFNGHAGSGIENATHFMPRAHNAPSTVRTDLFALGSTLFEIFQGGRAPYMDRGDREILELFSSGVFPNVECCGRPWGAVISRCWAGGFESTAEILPEVR